MGRSTSKYMNECLNCGLEVPQTPGKKQRKYCNDQCKQRHWHQKKQEGSGMVKISREEYELLLEGNFKNPLIIATPYERITDELKDHLKVDTEDLAKYIGKKLKENNPDKVAGKVVVKELDKEGSKPYNPMDNPLFKSKNKLK